MKDDVAFLLVTCCLDETRANVLVDVVDNLRLQFDGNADSLTVFDNASTIEWTRKLLTDNFRNVYTSDRNVGYWSAVDWWLNHIINKRQKYTYIIESDMIHFNFSKLWTAVDVLNKNDDIGSVRLHEYSVKNSHLYNKDKPVNGSKRNIWQSHTNKITYKPITLLPLPEFDDIYESNFLTQLPALNRYQTIISCFDDLKNMGKFSELDFQKFYHQRYTKTGIVDGGIFHCDPGCKDADVITGSWTDPALLNSLGYLETRYANIVDANRYNVTKLI